MCTVAPETVQAPNAAKLTVKPDVDVALTVKSASPSVLVDRAPKRDRLIGLGHGEACGQRRIFIVGGIRLRVTFVIGDKAAERMAVIAVHISGVGAGGNALVSVKGILADHVNPPSLRGSLLIMI